MNAETMNKVYKQMEKMTVEQIKEARDVHGHKMLNISPEAYGLFIHQCNYMIEKKQNGVA